MCALRRLCCFARLCAFGELCRLRRGYRYAVAITSQQEHYPRSACFTSPTATSLAIAVVVVYPYQTPAEGEYLAEGNEHGVVYLAHRRAAEARDEQDASEDA